MYQSIWCDISATFNYQYCTTASGDWHYNVEHIETKSKCCHFGDDKFKYIFKNKNCFILIYISLKFVLIDNKPALVQIMAGRRTGDKPLSEPMIA